MSCSQFFARLSFAVVFLATVVLAQKVEISGDVRDINTHQKISAVNIFVKGTQLGTSSDFAGRFSLTIPGAANRMVVVFHHIGYEQREIPLDSLLTWSSIFLQPRVIPMRGVEIEDVKQQRLEIDKDLPQAVSVIDAKQFDIRGYVDAGDLLKIDHSVQIEEDLSGRKTAAIRGGNADDVVVMYNGIKMNSAYDNIFDLSLIDPETIQRFEIIKGSNTALYGPEAFSGVINIVPKLQRDYHIRFQQRLGTYRSGNWGVHLYEGYKKLRGSYSFRKGGAERRFNDSLDDDGLLENSSTHHTANLSMNLSGKVDDPESDRIAAMMMITDLDYRNNRDNELVFNDNQLFSLRYDGALAGIEDLSLSLSYQNLNEEQNLNNRFGRLDRTFDDRSFNVDAEKRFGNDILDVLVAYQYQNDELDFFDDPRGIDIAPIGLQSAVLNRQQHGLVGIFKLHTEQRSEFLQKFDVDLSVRHDRVTDDQSDAILRSEFLSDSPDGEAGYFDKNEWNATTVKFALNLAGTKRDLAFNGFLSFGANTKFPTLRQQVSAPDPNAPLVSEANLNPEKNRSVELGFLVSRHLGDIGSIYGWEVSGNFFQNQYDNKFRTFTTPGIRLEFYDNIANAKISGLETQSNVFLFRKKVTLGIGLAKYFISEQAAFPFKSDLKRTVNFKIDHAGYSFLAHWFKEGEQIALLRSPDGSFGEVLLPEFNNLDLHVSKTFELFDRLKLFANASARNILNDSEVDLQGLAIRDRRFYVTVGAQY